jgi:hypothetical protein
MPITTTEVLGMLTEEVISNLRAVPLRPSQVRVDYYVQTRTPRGSRTRFQRVIGREQFPGGATSDFAVQRYLQAKHPGCDVEIMNTEWK